MQAAVNAPCNPVRLILTAVKASEYGQVSALTEGFDAGYVIADRGYDADAFDDSIKACGAEPVIPARRNRNELRDYDLKLCKERNLE